MVESSRSSHRSQERAVRPSRSILRKFIADTSGAIFIQMIVMFLFVMGVTGLVLDVGRIYVINTTAQAYVDQIALAAATELDGRTGAIERARRAAYGATMDDAVHQNNIIKKLIPFGEADDLVDLGEIFFLSDLPDDAGYQYEIGDVAPLVTNVDSEAEYVVVIARASGISTTLLRLVGWGAVNLPSDPAPVPARLVTSAVAVAGLEDGGICENAMFMFCNPNEASGPLSDVGTVRGRLMLLKDHGVNPADASWAPGNFSTVDLPVDVEGDCAPGNGVGNNNDNNGNSTSGQGCRFAANELELDVCRTRTVDMNPGQSLALHHGINMRFGIFGPQTEKFRDDPSFAPDVNVIKGLGYLESPPPAKKCELNDFEYPVDGYVDSVKLPGADCLLDASCTITRLSDPLNVEDPTLTSLQAYWTTNHSDHYAWATAQTDAETYYEAPFFPGQDLVLDTRYNMYAYELLAGSLSSPGGIADGQLLLDVGAAAGTNEVGDPVHGTPQCTSTEGVANRRVFILASVNCGDPDGDGDSSDEVAGNSSGVDVDEYYWGFLTEPVVNNGGVNSVNSIYIELIRKITDKEDPNILHSFPVLHK